MKLTRKILCFLMAAAVMLAVAPTAFAASSEAGKLCFKKDGTFNIVMFNDTQDDQNLNANTEKFIRAVIAREKPNLVVVAGDILSDMWPGATEEKLDKNIDQMCGIFDELKIPFAITMGNHDHDRADECSSIAHIMETATKHPYHVSTADGCDPATYSIPVYSADGSTVRYVVYMMDTNNKDALLSMSGYTGLYPEQVKWLRESAEKYKAANGGEYVHSTVFQHVPVAEIYDMLIEVPMSQYLDDGVVFSSNDHKWYKLNTTSDYPDMTGTLGEAPCSEIVSTGEYKVMTETGVVSAFFAHDHVNSFAATTKEGVYMGYNGGTGFNTYGRGGNRSSRVVRIHEDDTTRIDTNLVYYNDILNKSLKFYPTDILSPTLITKALQIVFFIPSVFCKIFGI